MGATLKDALDHLLSQALAQQFPAHPQFGMEIKPAVLRHVRDVVRQATQSRERHVDAERLHRDEVRRIAVPLRLGDMGETHFVLRGDWKSHFLRKKAGENVANPTVLTCEPGSINRRRWDFRKTSRIWSCSASPCKTT